MTPGTNYARPPDSARNTAVRGRITLMPGAGRRERQTADAGLDEGAAVAGTCSSSTPASHGDRDRADARSRHPVTVGLSSSHPVVTAASFYAFAEAVRSVIR